MKMTGNRMLPMLASIGIGAYAYYQMKKNKTMS
ncbi:DUF3918 family protein [Gracilibacillus salinarum]|uniref:DUF3918 family protein n=1 Tax=Gracilibacillus salinarum TaxID=2932255 RepID=A0ABY4GLZ0_9BACI|nr:DUF3918 family protein [Gracilibacillus salinarum]UOQ85390.1 DUF3918 family protein [Gracilibacillus salinarum]